MDQRVDHTQKIREILSQYGRLQVPVDRLTDSSDLHHAGLTSLASVGLMLALENEFGVEFADGMLGRKTFSSIAAIAAAVEQLLDK